MKKLSTTIIVFTLTATSALGSNSAIKSETQYPVEIQSFRPKEQPSINNQLFENKDGNQQKSHQLDSYKSSLKHLTTRILKTDILLLTMAMVGAGVTATINIIKDVDSPHSLGLNLGTIGFTCLWGTALGARLYAAYKKENLEIDHIV